MPAPARLSDVGTRRIGPDATPQLNRYNVPAKKEFLHLPDRSPHRRAGLASFVALLPPLDQILANDTGNDNHSARGVMIYAAGNTATDNGIYATFTDYYYAALSPTGWTLYAPTFREPGNGCWELTVVYPSNGTPFFGVWNWCIPGNGAYNYTKTIDQQTFDHYYGNQNYGDGLPAFTAQTIREQDGEHTLIWDWYFGRWDDTGYIATGTPPSSDGSGWDYYEYYSPSNSPCVNYPTTAARGVRVDFGSGLTAVTTSNSNFDYQGGYLLCFGDINPPATTTSYTYSPYTGDEWQVYDQ